MNLLSPNDLPPTIPDEVVKYVNSCMQGIQDRGSAFISLAQPNVLSSHMAGAIEKNLTTLGWHVRRSGPYIVVTYV
jgi:hypothetical protein